MGVCRTARFGAGSPERNAEETINAEEIMEDTRTLRELSEKELEQVCGGALTSENPGGQPQGASQTTTNSGGNAPPGQNKNLPPGLA
jgi:hypothetical protein